MATLNCPFCDGGTIVTMHRGKHQWKAACSRGCFTLPAGSGSAYESEAETLEAAERVIAAAPKREPRSVRPEAAREREERFEELKRRGLAK